MTVEMRSQSVWSRLRRAAAALLLAAVTAAPSLAQGTVSGVVKMNREVELPNVIVFVDGIKGDFAPPPKPGIVNQKGLQFIPKVLPVLKGTTVNFLNEDPILHDVFSPEPCAERLNLGTWQKGIVRTFTFNSIGCKAVLLCNIHPGMEGWIVVFDHPYFSAVDESGKYSIKDVPAGKHTVKTWHRKAKSVSKEVEVQSGQSASLDFDL